MPPWPWVSSTSPPLALWQVALPPGPSRERVRTRGTGRPPVRTRRKGVPRRPRAARMGARGVVKGSEPQGPGALALHPWKRWWGRRAPEPQVHPNPMVHGTNCLLLEGTLVFHTHERSAGGEGESAWAASRARENTRDRPRVQDQHPALLLGQQSEVNNKKSVNITTEVKSKISGCAPPATPAGLPGPRRAGRRGAAPGPAPAGRPAGRRRSR